MQFYHGKTELSVNGAVLLFVCLLFCIVGNPEINILIVVTEIASEDGEASDMPCGVGDCHPEIHRRSRIQLQLIDGNIGDLLLVHIGSVRTDGQRFQQPVLVPVGKPPGGGEEPLHVRKVARACPHADGYVVQVKMDVRRPLRIASRRFGTQLGGNADLCDGGVFWNHAGDQVFNIPLGEPENIGFEASRMSEISRVVDFPQDFLGGGQTTGGINQAPGILPDS